MATSNSQKRGLSVAQRVSYLFDLLDAHRKRRADPPTFDNIAADIAQYDRFLREVGGIDLKAARVMEIGVGQRPYRLIALQSQGVDAWGIDLDRPVIRPNVADLLRVLRTNGLLRALKTAVRTVLFDRADYDAFGAMLQRTFGVSFRYDPARVLVGNAGSEATWKGAPGQFDLIYSEDVFEHVPPEDLRRLVALMAGHMSHSGMAVVTPMVFTGISGGHELEWYDDLVEGDGPRNYPAWGHLTGETPEADTYLNRLKRVEYRALLEEHFVIVAEVPLRPNLGRRHLTPERMKALASFSDEELFSNSVRFFLRRK